MNTNFKGFDFDNFPSDETIAMLKREGYEVKELVQGWYPVHRQRALIRGWAKTERSAWRHCYNDYDQRKADNLKSGNTNRLA